MFQDFQSTRSSRQSSAQQFKFAPPQSLRAAKQAAQLPYQNYSVPCMNCETLVPVEQIDKHAATCTQVSKNVTAVLKSNKLCDEINFKISKLRESLQNLCAHESRKENLKYLIRADEICGQLFNIQHHSQIELRALQDLNAELKELTEAYRGSLCVALYLERLHSLALQKQHLLEKEQRQLQPLKCELPRSAPRNNSSNTPTLQNFQSPGLGRPTMITKFSGGSQDRPIQSFDIKSEILTKISSQLEGEELSGEVENSSGQFNQIQRQFYSKCLHQKSLLPNNHPSQKIPLCILHKEMLQRKLQPHQWESFIRDALNNPSLYLDLGKVQNSSGIRNNLIQMASEQQLRQRLSHL